MKNPLEHLDEVLARGPHFEIGRYFEDGFNFFKKHAGLLIGAVLMYLIISILLGNIPILGAILSSILVTPALTIGIFIMIHKLHYSEPEAQKFGNFWKGFDLKGKIIVTYLIIMVIQLALFLPLMGWIFYTFSGMDFNFGSFNPENPEELLELFNLVPKLPIIGAIIIFILLTIALQYVPLFLNFYGLEPMASIKYSFKFYIKNIVPITAFAIALMILAMLSLFLFCVGILLGLAIVYPALFFSFIDMTDYDKYKFSDEGVW